GMYNNFASIPFIYTETNYYNNLSDKYNIGWYNAVTKGGTAVTENTNGGNLFLTGNADKVRMLTLPEINNAIEKSAINASGYTILNSEEPAPGLFRLDQLKNITGLEDYDYSSNGYYWLASPYSSGTGNVRSVSYSGYVYYYNNDIRGVRPIISLRL
ncbi:MAG: DUF6273 domain-containing protein, partial [Clostridia bacterium]|nr:DUF6273 domain-containing protein [Clostridia bacterium]